MIPLIALALLAAEPLVVVVDRDDVEITETCRVRVVGPPIADVAGDGVVRVTGDGITVTFDRDAPLRGAGPDAAPDSLEGTGIVVTGRGVTLAGAVVSGFRAGVHARGAHGLTVEDCDLSGNFRQRLGSTAELEDPRDWLRPHENDRNEWLERYGAALYVEDANGVTVRRVRVREGQNGIVLDRVNGGEIYDNDCSFLSGWGLALWRSSGNVITRNAFDFCIRGYSHGVYNRGQDSAGILLFEQCSDNVIAENSATHGGDGLFAFAGREALGEVNAREDTAWYARRGNNGNVIVGNDFSEAAAHGIELTFSFDNAIVGNRLAGNAICGVWAGYSQDTLIAGNAIERNGEMAYGLERGGVNIEHGFRNRILDNDFAGNACGVHLWWDDDGALLATPWAAANERGSDENAIAGNRFRGEPVMIHLRETIGTTLITANEADNVGREVLAEGRSPVESGRDVAAAPARPTPTLLGTTRPVGARADLAGREHTILTEWGPYDWQGPLLHRVREDGANHRLRLLGSAARTRASEIVARGEVEVRREGDDLVISPRKGTHLADYEIEVPVAGPGRDRVLRARGVVAAFGWTVTAFAWRTDPRTDVDRWRLESRGGAVAALDHLRLRYGAGGPSDLPVDALRAAGLPADRFGTIAHTTGTIPAGRWLLRTHSDDGIRLWLDGELLIDDWTWHPDREHTWKLDFDEPRRVEIHVEHFELDGAALLRVEFERRE